MRILVTGGAGFIGSHTVDALLKEGHKVRILDNLQKPVHLKGKPSWLSKEAEFIFGDVRDKNCWEKSLKDIEAVYHFAAYQDYLTDFSKFFHSNAVGTALLYEVVVENNIDLSKIIVASSQFVQGEGLYECTSCGNKKVAPSMRSKKKLDKGDWEHQCPSCEEPMNWLWTSEDHFAPPNAYAMAKHSQEIQAINFGKLYDIPSVALRYSIVQGPRQSFYNTYSGACRIFSLNYYFNKSPVIYEDGFQNRDFVNIHDVVEANIMALHDSRMDNRIFNVGGGKSYTINDFSQIVKEEFQKRKNKELPEPIIPGLYRYGDTRHACSDISKIVDIGWEPKFSPKDSVGEYVDWLYEQDNVEDILTYSIKTMKGMGVIREIKR
jgi:dTDP-L-rhamnose 4-epimerase